MIAAMAPLIAIFILIAIALYIVPLWQICKKAGLSGPLSLLALIPVVGMLVVLYVVAFSDWRVMPVQQQYVPLPPQYPPPPSYPPQGPNV
ncbi:MAG: hypothetical protein M3R43_13275 [Acidobacteriota bacterium]|nr:hypothetical protein [Acidobacteriota bacterium]